MIAGGQQPNVQGVDRKEERLRVEAEVPRHPAMRRLAMPRMSLWQHQLPTPNPPLETPTPPLLGNSPLSGSMWTNTGASPSKPKMATPENPPICPPHLPGGRAASSDMHFTDILVVNVRIGGDIPFHLHRHGNTRHCRKD